MTLLGISCDVESKMNKYGGNSLGNFIIETHNCFVTVCCGCGSVLHCTDLIQLAVTKNGLDNICCFSFGEIH